MTTPNTDGSQDTFTIVRPHTQLKDLYQPCCVCSVLTKNRGIYEAKPLIWTVTLCSAKCQKSIHSKLSDRLKIASQQIHTAGAPHPPEIHQLLIGCASTSHADLTVTDPAVLLRKAMYVCWMNRVQKMYHYALFLRCKQPENEAKPLLDELHSHSNELKQIFAPYMGATRAETLGVHFHSDMIHLIAYANMKPELKLEVPLIQVGLAEQIWHKHVRSARDLLHDMQLQRVSERSKRVLPAWCKNKLYTALRKHVDFMRLLIFETITKPLSDSQKTLKETQQQALDLSSLLVEGLLHLWPPSQQKDS